MIEINWNPSRRELRFFGGGLALFAGLLTLLGSSAWDWPNGGIGLGVALASSAAGLTLFQPSWIKPIYVVWMVAVFPIGWTVSHLVLAIVYFGLFFPIALFLRLRGYDPLLRKSKPAGESYWSARKPVASPERYFRQY